MNNPKGYRITAEYKGNQVYIRLRNNDRYDPVCNTQAENATLFFTKKDAQEVVNFIRSKRCKLDVFNLKDIKIEMVW